MWWKRLIDGFRYNKKERQGLFFLLVVLVATTAYFYIGGRSTVTPIRNSDAYELARFKLDSMDHYLDSIQNSKFFLFDPNAVDSASLDSMGLPSFIAERWVKYIEAGGFFKNDTDVLKIYGVDSNWWHGARNYMVFGSVSTDLDSTEVAETGVELFRFLPDTMKESDWLKLGLTSAQAGAVKRYLEMTNGPVQQKDLDKIYVLDKEFLNKISPYVVFKDSSEVDSLRTSRIPINLIDAPALSVLTKWDMKKAERLISYRDKLGGFHSLSQIWETYGLDSTDLSPLSGRWELEAGGLKTIDINSAKLEELTDHPYISYKVAKEIVDFRDNIRPFRSMEELQKLRLMPERKLAKLAPYLIFVF
jgi:competence protein ComEA